MSVAERVVDAVTGRGPLAAAGRMRHRAELVVLAYHGVDDRASFARHLDHLATHFTVVSLDRVLAALDGTPLPPSAVLITFDDGERTVLTDGLPELTARELPSVVFAVPGVLDSDTPFWWVEAELLVADGGHTEHVDGTDGAGIVRALKTVPNHIRLDAMAQLRSTAARTGVRTPQLTTEELRALDRAGMRVENHSWTHPLLDRCTDAEIAEEIGRAAERLESILGRPTGVFAYPNGNVDDRVAAELARTGVTAAFLFDHHLSPMPPGDRLRISRVRVNSDTTIDRFARHRVGAPPGDPRDARRLVTAPDDHRRRPLAR